MRMFGILLLLGASIAAVAQKPPAPAPGPTPPPGVEAALRDRVAKFFEAQIAGKYRQADQYIAEDTKDYFYVLNKVPIIKFEIGRITYSDNFTKAKVNVKSERELAQAFIPKMRLSMDEPTDWKIENGLWCWTVDQTLTRTPFGEYHHPPLTSGAPAPEAPPPVVPTGADLTKTVAANKSEVQLAENGSDLVVLHNSMPGPVILSVEAPDAAGLEAKLDRTQLGPGGMARLLLAYSPAPGAAAEKVTVNVVVQPTGQVIPIQVKLKPAAGSGK